jgi:hypothetical protein
MAHPVINQIIRDHPQEFANAVFYGHDATKFTFMVPPPLEFEPPIGRIALSPKIAQKPRIVAVPLALADSMSRPLFYVLEHIEREVTAIGVMSHDEARASIQRALKENEGLSDPKTFCSYDQSSFTDNFDYDRIQRPILEALRDCNYITQYDIDVVDSINHGLWDADVLRKGALIRFGTGTGMGTPPSFPLACIGNYYLYAMAYEMAHGKVPDPLTPKPEAWVVGDDFATSDAETAHYYEEICQVIGLKLNNDKTLRSDYLAEFCGKIITSEFIMDKHKLMPNDSFSAIIDTAHYYGDRADRFFDEYGYYRPSVKRAYEAAKLIPAPIGAAPEVEHSQPTSELTPVQAFVRASQEAHELRTVIPDDKANKPTRDDWHALSRRKSALPITGDLPDYIRPEAEILDTLPLSHYEIMLAKNAVAMYKTLPLATTWDEFYQGCEVINTIYNGLLQHDSRRLEKLRVHSDHLLPIGDTEGKQYDQEVVKIANTLSGLTAPTISEGGMSL